MIKLNLYDRINLSNEDDIFDYIIESLRESIITWDFFVDWTKLIERLQKYEAELNLLNTLIGKSNSEELFIKLIEKYPQIKLVLPMLIAVRINKLNKFPIANNLDVNNLKAELKSIYFSVSNINDNKSKEELIRFYIESGIKSVIENKNIKNMPDYYFGVEVGIDTNARKNRTGILMEDIIENYISSNFSKYKNVLFMKQATQQNMYRNWKVNIDIDKSNRRFDFAIYNKDTGKNFLIETNYYGSGGSKLKATAGEYKTLNDFLKRQGSTLIWITDGLGWKTAKSSLRETFINNDYIFNLRLIKEGVLEEIVLK